MVRYARSFRPALGTARSQERARALCAASRAFVIAYLSLAHLLGEAADVVADDAELEDHQQVVDPGNESADRREYGCL